MPDNPLVYISATEALARFRAGTLRPSELMSALLARIESENPKVNAFTAVYAEEAMREAHAADSRYGDGTARPLEGIALAVKDNVPIAGHVVTYGSRLYAENRATYTHPGVERLLRAGAVVIGRTTLPEFAEAANCYTPLWGVTRNPWNTDFGPGGSSAGSAVALAAGMTTIADGNDNGGSLRIPASCCGVYGYKAPYGRNPNDRPDIFDPYMHYGPLARTVNDIRLMQSQISGRHVDDIGTLAEVVDYSRTYDISGWRVAYSLDLGYFPVDHEVRDNLLYIVEGLRSRGCLVEEVTLGWGTKVFDAWAASMSSRGSAARFVPDFERDRGELADYSADVIAKSKLLTASELFNATETHREMYRDLGPILEDYDAFLCPTTAVPSVRADRSPLDPDLEINGEPVPTQIAEGWFMTYPFNMLGQLPVLSVPSGTSSSGVPTGVQVVARAFDDLRVFAVAQAIEDGIYSTDFTSLLPGINDTVNGSGQRPRYVDG
ncbi:amidase [Paeniglutamicibacter sp. R2-26]|uniref:amidase n=1 Tax=Paeniglutamicibacter sp. R2-26 TaxID=3144417 RepID=UPI003EE506A5